MKIFRSIAKLTSWVIPVRKIRRLYRDYLEFFDLAKEIELTHNNYKNVILRLKDKIKTEKIKVVFIVRENQKWTYQSLYEEFEKSDKFEPLVAVSVLELAKKGKDKTRNNLEANFNFFKEKGMNVEYAYKDGEYIDLKELASDIVIYDQEWDLPKIHQPLYVSNFALTYHCAYGFKLLEERNDYTQRFHRFLYKFFVEHEENISRYGTYNKNNINNCFPVKYPKLDIYFKKTNTKCNLWKDNAKIKVIYAPHHSFEKHQLNLATFDKNGRFILELAKKHPETTWVFKPHPRFKYALLKNKIMDKIEAENYYSEWEQIGTVYTKGDYFDLMLTSDLMITDCCSFLAEYIPTLKPLIRLVNPDSVKLNPVGNRIMESYYSADNCSDIECLFEKLINPNNDTKKTIRESIKKEIIGNEPSANKLYNCILNDITKEVQNYE